MANITKPSLNLKIEEMQENEKTIKNLIYSFISRFKPKTGIQIFTG